MNQHDRQDQEVRNYVRNRMAGEVPPDFEGSVMNEIHRTPQRTRGPAWSAFAVGATVAAGALAVVVGLNILSGGGVGNQPSASSQPTASATASPSVGDGEFGPIHSMAAAAAFASPLTCEVTNAIVNAAPTTLAWRISYPDDWSPNEESTRARSACTLFAAEPFSAPDDQAIPESVAIVTDTVPGGDFGPGGEVVSMEEYTVDGVPAVRYEIVPGDGGFVIEPTVVWIIGIAGALPASHNDQPFIAISTRSADPAELALRTDVLDRMVATLEIGGE